MVLSSHLSILSLIWAKYPNLAQEARYRGHWVNDDPHTNSIRRLIISGEGGTLAVHGYGACGPDECDWGTASATLEEEPFRITFVFDGSRPDACCQGADPVQLTITLATVDYLPTVKLGISRLVEGGFETSTELLLSIIVHFHLLGTGIAGEPIPREYYSPNPSPIRSAARLDDTYT